MFPTVLRDSGSFLCKIFIENSKTTMMMFLNIDIEILLQEKLTVVWIKRAMGPTNVCSQGIT